ncbi:MAG: sulfatase [Cyclobacteriaceae bacterium]|nr:sulfatase [Cyclobacteriaceae bacterium HetDA_MAG_MS6]
MRPISLAACITVLVIIQACNQQATEEKSVAPNIVFILVDDLGQRQVGCYGSEFYRTPNIDELAKGGMRFTRAYASSPVCSPTRASIMTGKYPTSVGITDYIGGKDPRGSKLRSPSWQKYLPLSEFTLGEMLQSKGYRTAFFGKWHLSKSKIPPESLEHNPNKQGFQQTFITYKPSKDLARSWQAVEDDPHNLDTLTQLATDFIKKNQDMPFFLFLAHNAVHDPLMALDSVVDNYRSHPDAEKKQNNAVLGAMIEALDVSIGRILKTLENLELSKNTLVIFCSDNGGEERYASQKPFRKGKGWLHEGGIRIPLIIRWPGHIKSGIVNNTLVSTMDFFPTLHSITGQGDDAPVVDGIDISPLLLEGKGLSRNTIYWHHPHYHTRTGMKPAGAIISGRYKLIEWYEEPLLSRKPRLELYDIYVDQGETQNLAKALPREVKRLQGYLDTWRNISGAQMPTRR